MENRIIQITEEGDNDKWGISHSHLIYSFQGTWTAGSSSTHDTTNCFRFQRAVPTGLHSLTLFRGWITKWLTAMPQNTVWQQRGIVCWHTWHEWIIRALITWWKERPMPQNHILYDSIAYHWNDKFGSGAETYWAGNSSWHEQPIPTQKTTMGWVTPSSPLRCSISVRCLSSMRTWCHMSISQNMGHGEEVCKLQASLGCIARLCAAQRRGINWIVYLSFTLQCSVVIYEIHSEELCNWIAP